MVGTADRNLLSRSSQCSEGGRHTKVSYKWSNLKNRNPVPNFPEEVTLELRSMRSKELNR